MVVRLAPSAARRIRCLPTATDPVKLTLRMTGEASRWRDTWSGTPKTQLATSFGNPESSRQLSTSMAEPGASSGGLIMMEQPTPIAAPNLRAGLPMGKFQGQNAATGPTGSFMTRDSVPAGRTNTRPYTRCTSPA